MGSCGDVVLEAKFYGLALTVFGSISLNLKQINNSFENNTAVPAWVNTLHRPCRPADRVPVGQFKKSLPRGSVRVRGRHLVGRIGSIPRLVADVCLLTPLQVYAPRAPPQNIPLGEIIPQSHSVTSRPMSW